jgi:hypothetical protein
MRIWVMVVFGLAYMAGAMAIALWRVWLSRALGADEFRRLHPQIEPWFPLALIGWGLVGGVVMLFVVRAELRRDTKSTS